MKNKLFTLLFAFVAIATTAQENTIDGHEYVDLGLPSGALWATCNVGATKPEEYGDYFAWGETTPKENYDRNTYKWYNELSKKYAGSNCKTELDLEDDAAAANWGCNWQMPSLDQINELIDNCDWEWTTLNGVNGSKVTSKINGKSIFLPAAGSRNYTSLSNAGSRGNYWSRSLSIGFTERAVDLGFSMGELNNIYHYICEGGLSVRPVVVVVNNQSSGLILNATNFPDANFRASLASILKISEGDEITTEKIAATTSIDVFKLSNNTPAEQKIADLTGIEHFTALTKLNCSGNNLTSLDVSKNTALTELYCSWNQLTSLDVSKNTALTKLWCNRNQLTSLDVDVSGCGALGELECSWNQLTSLDLSGCTALSSLNCHYNQLTSLDVSGLTALEELSCESNQLTSLDLSGCTALPSLNCKNNQLTSLDVSGCTALSSLNCNNNQLTSLDVSQNTALYALSCEYNQLTSLNLSQNTVLEMLWCNNNQLTSLDFSKKTNVSYLSCYSNQLNGKVMDALVASLPTCQWGRLYVINTADENEGNVCTKSHVAVVKGKEWRVYCWRMYSWYGSWDEYEGSDETNSIGASLNDNGQRINENYYSIDGVKFSGEPRKKVVYIRNGRKVLR